MKMLRLAAFAAFAFIAALVGPAHALDCTQSTFYDASTSGATKLISGIATQRVFICGYTLVGGGTATVKFETGTGTNCATNETAITPAYTMVSGTVIPDNPGVFAGLVAGPALDFCIKTSAGVAIQALIYYKQQ